MLEVLVERERLSRFCHLCGQPLDGRYYRHSSGLVCCTACQTGRPHCARCDVPLDDAAIARSSASASAADEPPLCQQCLRTTPRCNACHRHITGTWYTFEELLPPAAVRRFCERCVHHRPRCDLCRVPVSPDITPFDDGQYRCALCAAEMVLGDGPVGSVYRDAIAAFGRVVEGALHETPRLEIVGRRQMGDVRRQYNAGSGAEPSSVVGHHVLGFFVRSNGNNTIYVERGLPRSLLLGTLAHELGHAWQTEHGSGIADALIAEGFAEWVAHHVLVMRGHRAVAARATRREDLYGRGLRHFLAIERTKGREGVLLVARGKG